MSWLNLNVLGGTKASLTEISGSAFQEGHWARIQMMDGRVELKYLHKGNKAHKQLLRNIKAKKVRNVVTIHHEELKDIDKVFEKILEDVRAALILVHILKKHSKKLLEIDIGLEKEHFPEENIKNMEREAKIEFIKMNKKLRDMANMLLGESNKS